DHVIPNVPSVPLILSVGRLVPKKGLNDLILACRLLKLRRVKFRCAIVGKGPLRGEFESQISKLGLEGNVTLVGAMAHDRLVSLYGEATVFALCPYLMKYGDRHLIHILLPNSIAAQ